LRFLGCYEAAAEVFFIAQRIAVVHCLRHGAARLGFLVCAEARRSDAARFGPPLALLINKVEKLRSCARVAESAMVLV
jgi:hypothetical protein